MSASLLNEEKNVYNSGITQISAIIDIKMIETNFETVFFSKEKAPPSRVVLKR